MNDLHKREGPLAGGPNAVQQSTVAAKIVRDGANDDKRFTTLRAIACIAGHELHRDDGGGFTARRWGWARQFSDLDAVAGFLTSITGRRVV